MARNVAPDPVSTDNNGNGADTVSDNWRSDAVRAGARVPERHNPAAPSSGTVEKIIARDATEDPDSAEELAASSGAEADAERAEDQS